MGIEEGCSGEGGRKTGGRGEGDGRGERERGERRGRERKKGRRTPKRKEQVSVMFSESEQRRDTREHTT